MTTFIEFVGAITFLIHLLSKQGSTFSLLLHSMTNKLFIMPYAFLKNTSHNKDRILEHGWKNVLRNMINCGSPSRSENVIEIDPKKTNTKPIEANNESVKIETKDVYTIRSSKNQKRTDVNDDSINLEPSHSKMLVDTEHSKPTCHQDIELPLLDLEELQYKESLESLALRQLDGMSNCLEGVLSLE